MTEDYEYHNIITILIITNPETFCQVNIDKENPFRA